MHLFIKFSKKASITILGFGVLVLGAIMLFTPGPGWLFIILGLGLLATEYKWARDSLEAAKNQYEKAKQKALSKLAAKQAKKNPGNTNSK